MRKTVKGMRATVQAAGDWAIGDAINRLDLRSRKAIEHLTTGARGWCPTPPQLAMSLERRSILHK